MRLFHFSDSHGFYQKPIGYYDAIVSSGDLLSEPPRDLSPLNKAEWQYQRLKQDIQHFTNCYGDAPFFFCAGNHDWIHPFQMEELLQRAGMNAHCLNEKIIHFNGINLYGFPYVPPISGTYAYEAQAPYMLDRIDEMCSKLNSTYVDVLVAHCPPIGSLSFDYHQNTDFGNSGMANALDYKINKDMLPVVLMCGHIHSAAGLTMRNGVLISNAATRSQIIEL